MSDRAQGSATGNIAAVPNPVEARSGPATVQPQRPGGCRATVRDALDAALYGIRPGGRDRQFFRSLVHWDKRNAAALASLFCGLGKRGAAR
jgi:hypothetical protein